MKRERPMSWQVFFGSVLTMFSLFGGFLINYTILDQPYHTDTTRVPFGKEPLAPIATILSIVLLVLGLALVFTGLKKMETR